MLKIILLGTVFTFTAVLFTQFAQAKSHKSSYSGKPGERIAGIFRKPGECDATKAPGVKNLIKKAKVTNAPKKSLKPGRSQSAVFKKCRKIIFWRQIDFTIPATATTGQTISVKFKTKRGSKTIKITVK